MVDTDRYKQQQQERLAQQKARAEKQAQIKALQRHRHDTAKALNEHRYNTAKGVNQHRYDTAKGLQDLKKNVAKEAQKAQASGKPMGRFGAAPKASGSGPTGSASLVGARPGMQGQGASLADPNRDRRDLESDAAKGIGTSMVGQSATLADPNRDRKDRSADPRDPRNGRDAMGRALTGSQAKELADLSRERDSLLNQGPPTQETEQRIAELTRRADEINRKDEAVAKREQRVQTKEQQQQQQQNLTPAFGGNAFPPFAEPGQLGQPGQSSQGPTNQRLGPDLPDPFAPNERDRSAGNPSDQTEGGVTRSRSEDQGLRPDLPDPFAPNTRDRSAGDPSDQTEGGVTRSRPEDQGLRPDLPDPFAPNTRDRSAGDPSDETEGGVTRSRPEDQGLRPDLPDPFAPNTRDRTAGDPNIQALDNPITPDQYITIAERSRSPSSLPQHTLLASPRSAEILLTTAMATFARGRIMRGVSIS
jgi:hypothetical protein